MYFTIYIKYYNIMYVCIIFIYKNYYYKKNVLGYFR